MAYSPEEIRTAIAIADAAADLDEAYDHLGDQSGYGLHIKQVRLKELVGFWRMHRLEGAATQSESKALDS